MISKFLAQAHSPPCNEMPENATNWLLPDALADSGTSSPIALRFGGQSFTYRGLLLQINQIARFLLAQGLAPRECLGLILRDSPLFVATFLAGMKIGAIPALVSTFATDSELEHILNLCSARFVITQGEGSHTLTAIRGRLKTVERTFVSGLPARVDSQSADEALAPFAYEAESTASVPTCPTNPEDPAFFLFTSGSTGHPKAVIHSHSDIRHTVENYGQPVLGLSTRDRTFSSSRLFFAYGLGNSLSFPLAARATSILCDEKPTPEVICRIFRDESPTVFFGVPAVYRALLEHHRLGGQIRTSSLRFCVSAGEVLPAPVFEEWKKTFGVEILDGIGTTEALHMFISNHSGNTRAGSSGTLLDGYDARILDEFGREVEGEKVGNLWVRGNTFGRYYTPAVRFSTASTNDWIQTGDIYRRDEHGLYYFCGRSSDHFKVQGLWVSPIGIEEALLGHEAVLEAGVVGVMDSTGLLTPRAHVVVRQGRHTTAPELRLYLSTRLHSHQIPREIIFMEQLPRTATGKLQRYKLREFIPPAD